ncbi:MAG: insulinase family protein [Candidatus Omnitrophica bacterium]|nr:insulinase family protein [Candidatus Omnitrophota bacterium]
MYYKTDLDNGLKIISHPMPNTHSVALGLWLNVGGRYENKKNKGIAHFFEHLAFKGTKKYSSRQIKESIEGVGGSLNGFTSEEFTCYFVKIPSVYLKRALDILSDMILNPCLPASEIEKERTVILEEIKMHKDMPQSYVYELLDELLWPGHPLGLSIIGNVESIMRLRRKDLLDFKEKYYTLPNLIIAACGQLEQKKVLDYAKEIFFAKACKQKNIFLKVEEKQRKPQLKILDKNTEQTHLALGFPGLSRNHPDRYALMLLHIIMGANMSSRLFDHIRERKGLAYDIGTQVKFFHDSGAFLVHAGIDNRNVPLTIRLILKELQKIKKEVVSADELRRAKEFYLGQLLLALEDTLDHMLWMGEYMAAVDKVYTWQEVRKLVNRVSGSQIRDVARNLFKQNNLCLSLIGPLKNSEKEIKRCLEIY